MGKIYKIVNDVNSKIYIGKTTRSLQTRFEEHIKNTSNCKSAISAAIQKYGEKHFQIQLIEDNIPDEQLNQKERYWINFYDSYRKGYNLTPGGDGKSLSDEEILKKVNYFTSKNMSKKDAIETVSELYGVRKNKIKELIK